MAALPYMQLYIADYLADTMHLSTEEHGAYLLLMFNYWQTGRSIPKNRLAKIARMSNDRWLSVEESLKEFFIDNGTDWVHERIERDLTAVMAVIEQKSAAGKASAAKRKAEKGANDKRKSNGRSTGVEIPLEQKGNGNPTNKDKDKDKDKDLKEDPPLNPPRGKGSESSFDPLVVELPEWLSTELWREWVLYRRQLKKPIKTQQGVTGTLKKLDEYRKLGHAPETVIGEAMANEWQGLFEPKNSQVKNARNESGSGSLAERQLQAGREQWLREQSDRHASMAAMGEHDADLRPALDCEEWQSTYSSVGAADWHDDR